MGAVVVALLVVTALVLLATGGGSGSDADRGELSRDGLLTVVEPDRLVLQTDGGAETTFAVRPIDARRLDLAHLAEHRDQGLQSRVFFLRQDGELYATRVDDLQTTAP